MKCLAQNCVGTCVSSTVSIKAQIIRKRCYEQTESVICRLISTFFIQLTVKGNRLLTFRK
jgi:hypothetical protein